MILVQSTIKDTPDNVRRFVHRNLAGGADHLLVFLDARAPEVESWLDDHDHVTCVRAYGRWWAGSRPAGLNYRQSINTTLTARLLAEVDWVDWLFHVDGDEAVHLDHAALAAVPSDRRAVRLLPMEVASHPDLSGAPVWFKRLLDPDELVLLRALGVLDRGGNGRYFRGHTRGKVGLRPSPDLRVTNHQVVDREGHHLDALADQGFQVLHYESQDRDEFVRKWLALMTSGPILKHRPQREPVARAIAALLKLDLGEEQTRFFLGRLYDRTAVDDVDTLRSLGLLVQVDLDGAPERPERLPDEARGQLRTMLQRAREVNKDRFRPRAPGEDLDEVARSLRWDVGA